MRFVDEVVIRVQSGAGGNGCVSFRREKFVPKGGPDGGNGGRGGNVYFVPTSNKWSLLDFKYQPIYRAQRGSHGMGKGKTGRSGEDTVISVPMGTLIYDEKTGGLLGDLIKEETPHVIAKGGKGGRGNHSFATSVNRAPRRATTGNNGEAFELRLELKLLADVGLVGLPNAGKSSLLRVLSKATPKVADYPFTTLSPNLGVAEHKGKNIVIADLPGLICGASVGAGLGHQFLRHVSRNHLLLHVVDASFDVEQLEKNISTIRGELGAYDPVLLDREELIVFTKIDLLDKEQWQDKQERLRQKGLEGFWISSEARLGLPGLMDRIARQASQWVH